MNDEKIKKISKQKAKKKNRTATFNLIEVIIIIIMTSLIVGVSTGVVVYKNYNEIDKRTSKGEDKDYLKELEAAYKNILNSYVESVDEKGLTNAAIEAMYKYLGDPYTSYLDQDTTSDLMDRLNGEYSGIGVEIQKIDEGVLVTNIFEDSPAEKSGMLVGDIIIKINGEDVRSNTVKEVSEKIKSKEPVKITVYRSGIEKEITTKAQNVIITSVTKNNYEGVGYIKISTFSNTTYSQFKNALESLESEGISSLIIDVRNNGGGYLSPAVEIAELFVTKGKNIYGLESKDAKEMYKDKTNDKRDYKVVILTNGATASASEILTAALKESYGATIVGTTTYGKGTVQETSTLETGGMVKYTTAYWLTPDGNKINGIGIKPDIEIDGEENQLTEAINRAK